MGLAEEEKSGVDEFQQPRDHLARILQSASIAGQEASDAWAVLNRIKAAAASSLQEYQVDKRMLNHRGPVQRPLLPTTRQQSLERAKI